MNRYDSTPGPGIFGFCYLDPVDDGDTEDHLFDHYGDYPPVGLIESPYLSVRGWNVTHAAEDALLGPSSIRFPQRVFASAGDTDDPFDPDNLNGPAEGPGLRGDTGLGTWVEPRFSLDRYRGRRIRLLFLTTGWSRAAFIVSQEGPWDDGWWIDDVMVTHTLTEPATVTADDKDDPDLARDMDGDCVADDADCMPSGDQDWSLPGEVVDLQLSHTGGVDGTTTLSWAGVTRLGSTAVNYVVVAEDPGACSESVAESNRSATDTVTPAPGVLRQFLVAAANGCGRGALGRTSSGGTRAGCD